MRAVVTGVAGFIGSRLAQRLLNEGSRVLGIDRLSDYYDLALKRRNLERLGRMDGFELATEDLREARLGPMLAGADVVFHFAAQPGARGGWGTEYDVYVRDNVLATQRLLDAASAAKPGRIVFASSSSIYGEAERLPTVESLQPAPISPYGTTKLIGEHLCRLYSRPPYGVPTVILRYFTVFGPGQRPDMAIARFLDAALAGRPIEVFGDGRQARELTYVDDAIEATLAAGERGRPGTIYNVSGGSEVSVRQIIERIGALVGGAPEVVHLPPDAVDPRRTAADTSLARAELGFRPRTSFEEGLARQLEALADFAPSVADRVPKLLE